MSVITTGGSVSIPSISSISYDIANHNGACVSTYVPSNKVQYSPAGQKMDFSGLAVLKLQGGRRKLALFQVGEDADAVKTSYYDVTIGLQEETVYEAKVVSSSIAMNANFAKVILSSLVTALLWN